jgi:capsular polysaccharide biosynthesis protein
LSQSWKTILVAGVIGLFGSLAFVFSIPNQYEALAQIKMAMFYESEVAELTAVNIENPNTLVFRYKTESSYTSDNFKKCESEKSNFPKEKMTHLVKFAIVKGVDSAVELKVRRASKELAFACAQSIYESIREYQAQSKKNHIENLTARLLKYQIRQKELQSFISRADNLGSAISLVYIHARDEQKFLSDQIFRINQGISLFDENQAKLLAPIYVSPSPVYPNKKLILVSGLLAGLFLGLLFNLAHKVWRNYQVK